MKEILPSTSPSPMPDGLEFEYRPSRTGWWLFRVRWNQDGVVRHVNQNGDLVAMTSPDYNLPGGRDRWYRLYRFMYHGEDTPVSASMDFYGDVQP